MLDVYYVKCCNKGTFTQTINKGVALCTCLWRDCSMLQRRRTAEDELNMRTVYTEGDLISVST